MKPPVITIIGSGNMGGSLIAGLLKAGFPANQLWATDPSEEKLQALQKNYQINTTKNNIFAVQQADVIIFAIKPQVFKTVVEPLKTSIQKKRPLIISIAAGINTASIEKWLGEDIAIVRAMPNTPALIGCGATGLFANANIAVSHKTLVEEILTSTGNLLWVNDESMMDIVTALSGSGPAYFFLIMEAMQHAAEGCGLPSEVAKSLTLQTAYGAARMALESNANPAELRKNVTSPGGTTEKAIAVLEENNIHGIFQQAIYQAKQRSEELAKTLGE